VFFLEANPAFRSNLLFQKLFLQGFAGTSVGRSAKPAKNSFSLKRIFTSIGAKALRILIIFKFA
jgi:hypothetical protein